MNKIFSGFIIVGIIGVICVSLWGIIGAYSYNMIFLAYLLRPNFDEREKQLSQRTFAITMGIAMVVLINGYILSHFIDFGSYFIRNWVGYIIGFIFIVEGITGHIVFRRN